MHKFFFVLLLWYRMTIRNCVNWHVLVLITGILVLWQNNRISLLWHKLKFKLSFVQFLFFQINPCYSVCPVPQSARLRPRQARGNWRSPARENGRLRQQPGWGQLLSRSHWRSIPRGIRYPACFFYHSVKTTFIMSYIYILLLQTLIFSYNVHLCSFKLSGRSGGHDHLRRKWVWWLWNGKAARYVLCNILMFCKIPNAQPYLMCPNILYNWDIVHQWYHVSFFLFCF